MPFTISHAAAVLPFRKLNLVWSAFIIGSMAPDFPYVVGSTYYRDIGHNFPGLVWFTVPASVVGLWLYHNVFKQPVTELLPASVQARLVAHNGRFSFGGAARFAAILGSILLGIATHLIWDSFTHAFTWPWREFAMLRERLSIPLLGAVPGYAALQYASSVLGMLALAVWVWLWYRDSGATVPSVAPSQSRFPLALAMFAVAALAGLARAMLLVGAPVNRGTADVFMLVFGVTAFALAFWELLFYCVLVSTHQVWTLG